MGRYWRTSGSFQWEEIIHLAEDIYFMTFFIAVALLFRWSLGSERLPPGQGRPGPFAMRDDEDYRRRFGDRTPF